MGQGAPILDEEGLLDVFRGRILWMEEGCRTSPLWCDKQAGCVACEED